MSGSMADIQSAALRLGEEKSRKNKAHHENIMNALPYSTGRPKKAERQLNGAKIGHDSEYLEPH